MRVCVRVRACVRACVRAWVCVCVRVFIQTEPLTSELMEIGHTFTAELTVDASAWERAQLRAADVQLCVMLPNDRMHRPPPGMKAIWGHTAMVLLPVTSAPAEAAPASVVLRASMPRPTALDALRGANAPYAGPRGGTGSMGRAEDTLPVLPVSRAGGEGQAGGSLGRGECGEMPGKR